MINKFLIFLLSVCAVSTGYTQQSELSVEKIMQDPAWMGTFPSNIHWSADSQTIYFDYNLEGAPSDSLYKINIDAPDKIVEVHYSEAKKIVPRSGDYNDDRSLKVYTRDGDLWLYERKQNTQRKALELGNAIENPQFLADNNRIAFNLNDNAFIYDLKKGSLEKITNFHSGKKKGEKDEHLSEQDVWLKKENLSLLQVVREREEKEAKTAAYFEMVKTGKPVAFYSGEENISGIRVSPNAKFVVFRLFSEEENENTIVPNYVDASGYTTDLPARSKVGGEQTQVKMGIYSLAQDSVYFVQTENLPGITDLPAYTKHYPDKEWEEKVRAVIPSGPYFSENGKKAVVNIRSQDNKDRWIVLLDLETGKIETLDRQHDDAWIAGPGIGWTYSGATLGWLPDNKHIYFQSEASGYSHLYLLNVETGKKKQLTSGKFEVFDPFLSNNGRYWYLTTSKVHPGERHFYKMPVMGGKMVQLTSMTGNNQVFISPNENYMAIRYSFSNTPWELYLKPTEPNVKARQLTHGQSDAFKKYDWRAPDLVKFKAEDGTMVPARLYLPEEETKNGAAVIFVHGAGYLQQAHKWWSYYFREYMFNNLLTDLGYTVMAIDYRGSAGYGSDWRTAIYRHMGGKDLSDQVDGAEYLVAEHGIDPDQIGIYGGSYGGFITLMAMFQENETFTAGAAIRSVTDWAHYNHGYTSNILNTPTKDPIAYRRSAPIYFAEGFDNGHLLILHGMQDRNVHFQDVVRLVQRLIELKKENWELAIYPTEGHGFVTPTSWMDEYKRILELFNKNLLD